jgi:hypothetical protein
MKRIFPFELEGRKVLGFDTGLDSAAFAKTRLAQILTHGGYVVPPSLELPVQGWTAKGVIEREGSMVIWGPSFGEDPVKRLDLLITAGPADQGLDALNHWLRARFLLPGGETLPPPFPAGALLSPDGAVLFPPEALIRRVIVGDEWYAGAEKWTHPDLAGNAAVSFCAAALLYRVFCGVEPFPAADIETLRLDMREGNFLPPDLAAPGLDERAAKFITGSLSCGKLEPAPDLKTLLRFLRSPPSRAVLNHANGVAGSKTAAYFRPQSDEERAKLALKREKYEKKRTGTVKTRRFIRRNTAIIGGIAAGALILGLVAWSLVSSWSERPTTQGMSPREVVESYYQAMDTLDHEMMEACVLKNNETGKADISMIVNLTVITKVRQAYEQGQSYIPAREWLEAGSPATEAVIFGPVELRIQDAGARQPGSEPAEEAAFEARYTMWLPGEENQLHRDELRLVLYKNAWRIAEITRE